MKISCPKCGQHYEIEVASIDRVFRCIECDELFNGMNAKPVKPPPRYKFKKRLRAGGADHRGNVLLETDPEMHDDRAMLEDMDGEDLYAESGPETGENPVPLVAITPSGSPTMAAIPFDPARDTVNFSETPPEVAGGGRSMRLAAIVIGALTVLAVALFILSMSLHNRLKAIEKRMTGGERFVQNLNIELDRIHQEIGTLRLETITFKGVAGSVAEAHAAFNERIAALSARLGRLGRMPVAERLDDLEVTVTRLKSFMEPASGTPAAVPAAPAVPTAAPPTVK